MFIFRFIFIGNIEYWGGDDTLLATNFKMFEKLSKSELLVSLVIENSH